MRDTEAPHEFENDASRGFLVFLRGILPLSFHFLLAFRTLAPLCITEKTTVNL